MVVECIKIIKKSLSDSTHPFFSLFTVDNKYDENENKILADIEMAYTSGGEILWYPSSGRDVSDIEFVTKENIWIKESITIESEPQIFIHTDPLINEYAWDDPLFGGMEYTLYEGISLSGHEVKIYELKGLHKKYLIIIKILNDKFFAQSIGKISLNFLYTFCDGITSGMGIEVGISTLFYTQFYKSLGVTYHFTEYHLQHTEKYNDFQLAIINYLEANQHINIDEDFPFSIQNKIAHAINHRRGYLRVCR